MRSPAGRRYRLHLRWDSTWQALSQKTRPFRKTLGQIADNEFVSAAVLSVGSATILLEDVGKLAEQGCFALGSDDALHRLTVFEQNQRRD